MNINQRIQVYLSKLSAIPETSHSLWKAIKKLKRPQTDHPPIRKQNGSWARSEEKKAETFVEHFSKVFKPNKEDYTRGGE